MEKKYIDLVDDFLGDEEYWKDLSRVNRLEEIALEMFARWLDRKNNLEEKTNNLIKLQEEVAELKNKLNMAIGEHNIALKLYNERI